MVRDWHHRVVLLLYVLPVQSTCLRLFFPLKNVALNRGLRA
jgi:hypothetical protein